jgi:glycerol-3-phosphate acyltransferase PlsY
VIDWLIFAALASGAYALGGVSAAYYLVRLRTGQDVREAGSGTAGATNAGRLLGGWAYLVVALLDLAKGALAVAAARWLVAEGILGGPEAALAPVAALVAVVAGHIWPPQLGLRGGKGVATIFGGVLVLAPAVALAALGVFVLLYLPTRRYHLSGQVGIAAAPVIGWWRDLDGVTLAGLTLAVALVLLVHYTRRSGAA